MLSEQQFDTYAKAATADCEGSSDPIMVVQWREEQNGSLHFRSGCWVRETVADPETQAFLDTLSNMQITLMN